MRIICILLFCFSGLHSLMAQDFTGIYTFSKGINKATGTCILQHTQQDSAFIMLQAVSGAPEFETLEYKCMVSLQQQPLLLQINDSCILQLRLKPNALVINLNESSACQCNPSGNYRRTSHKICPPPNWLPAENYRIRIALDSVQATLVPGVHSKPVHTFVKMQELSVLDSFGDYLMVEYPGKPKSWLWIPVRYTKRLKAH